MVKFFLTALLLCSFSYGSILEVVKNYIDPPTYRAKQNLIKALFAQEDKYINKATGKADTIKIVNTLKNNGLLSLSYKAAQTLNLTFEITTKPLLSMRVVNDVLESLGYTYYLTKSIKKDGDNISWSVNINTQNIVDPIMLRKKLKAQGCHINSIDKNGPFGWVYSLNTQNARLETISISSGVPKRLGRPTKPYWLHVNHAKGVRIQANPSDRWFPHITLFDDTLVPIDEIMSDKNQKSLYVEIPKNATYIRVDDKFLLDNIKRGLEITIVN